LEHPWYHKLQALRASRRNTFAVTIITSSTITITAVER
jgi:hypothetical protein